MLLLAVVIVGVGYYTTQYLPPRRHVITVEGAVFDAADVRDRTSYFLLRESLGRVLVSEAVVATLDRIEDGFVLRIRGPELVGEVTDEDFERAMREQLGFLVEDPDAEDPDAEDSDAEDADAEDADAGGELDDTDDDGAEAGQPNATAEAIDDGDDGFADAFAAVVRNSELPRDRYEALKLAELYADRVLEHFRSGFDESGPQLQVARLAVVNRAVADEIRDRAAGGEEFGALVAEFVDGALLADVDVWLLRIALDDEQLAALDALAVGDVSVVVERRPGAEQPLQFEVYVLLAAEDDRPFDDGQLDPLLAELLAEWLDDGRATLAIDRRLSSGEGDWIVGELCQDIRILSFDLQSAPPQQQACA